MHAVLSLHLSNCHKTSVLPRIRSYNELPHNMCELFHFLVTCRCAADENVSSKSPDLLIPSSYKQTNGIHTYIHITYISHTYNCFRLIMVGGRGCVGVGGCVGRWEGVNG